ncbi:MAG: YceI family protein [Sphingobacteriales bacterium]|nr:YceI family protein [Sphingobacteriales bacterium]MBI3717444.1 YceI family protein [Sphingobacteriales bacterium]
MMLITCSIAGNRAITIFITSNGTISFRSDAPFELIRASSKELKGAVETDKKTFSFKVRMRSFQGFNSPLQREHFNENYMESESYPEATFNGKIIEDIDFNTPGKYIVRAKGILSIHGIEQERIIKSEVEIKQGSVLIKSNFTVLLSDHKILIPKVVSEKLANEIKVEVIAELLPKQ